MSKKILGIATMFALAGVMADDQIFDTGRSRKRKSWEFDETNVSGKKAGKQSQQGMQRFVIDGKEIFAMNRKNAVRKANQK